jgi:hypothetical protein
MLRNPREKSELLTRRVLVFVGGYGAGKTQVSISMALHKVELGLNVSLVDLDLINPYFRSREMTDLLEEKGIEMVRPEGDLAFAENPSLVPGIEDALRNKEKHVILDSGGDPTGATILGRFQPFLTEKDVAVLQVVNVFRPFSTNTDEIIKLKNDLEEKSRISIQGWINNSNLQDWTTLEDWKKGQSILVELVRKTGIPLAGVAVQRNWAEKLGIPWESDWIPVQRYLNLGWKI